MSPTEKLQVKPAHGLAKMLRNATTPITVSAIYARTPEWVIGKESRLPWPKNKEDMSWFQQHTKGKVCIVGRETFDSWGGTSLKGRQLIVLTRDVLTCKSKCADVENVVFVECPTLAYAYARAMTDDNGEDEMFILGGSQIYDIYMHDISKIYETVFTNVTIDEDDDTIKLSTDFQNIFETCFKEGQTVTDRIGDLEFNEYLRQTHSSYASDTDEIPQEEILKAATACNKQNQEPLLATASVEKEDPEEHPWKILCLDFDGVCHQYDKWKGVDVIDGPPVPGFLKAITTYVKHYDVQIYSARCSEERGACAIEHWLDENIENSDLRSKITVARHKPTAMISLDDRGSRFTGYWPSKDVLKRLETPYYRGPDGYFFKGWEESAKYVGEDLLLDCTVPCDTIGEQRYSFANCMRMKNENAPYPSPNTDLVTPSEVWNLFKMHMFIIRGIAVPFVQNMYRQFVALMFGFTPILAKWFWGWITYEFGWLLIWFGVAIDYVFGPAWRWVKHKVTSAPSKLRLWWDNLKGG